MIRNLGGRKDVGGNSTLVFAMKIVDQEGDLVCALVGSECPGLGWVVPDSASFEVGFTARHDFSSDCFDNVQGKIDPLSSTQCSVHGSQMCAEIELLIFIIKNLNMSAHRRERER